MIVIEHYLIHALETLLQMSQRHLQQLIWWKCVYDKVYMWIGAIASYVSIDTRAGYQWYVGCITRVQDSLKMLAASIPCNKSNLVSCCLIHFFQLMLLLSCPLSIRFGVSCQSPLLLISFLPLKVMPGQSPSRTLMQYLTFCSWLSMVSPNMFHLLRVIQSALHCHDP